MTSEQFAYWLQGFAELNEQPPTPEQWQMIREHLSTVFHKVTPELKPNTTLPYTPSTWPHTMASGIVAVDTTARLVC